MDCRGFASTEGRKASGTRDTISSADHACSPVCHDLLVRLDGIALQAGLAKGHGGDVLQPGAHTMQRDCLFDLDFVFLRDVMSPIAALAEAFVKIISIVLSGHVGEP